MHNNCDECCRLDAVDIASILKNFKDYDVSFGDTLGFKNIHFDNGVTITIALVTNAVKCIKCGYNIASIPILFIVKQCCPNIKVDVSLSGNKIESNVDIIEAFNIITNNISK